MNNSVFKIRHKHLKLFFQPQKSKGNGLSKGGKVYQSSAFANEVVKGVNIIRISSDSPLIKVLSEDDSLDFNKDLSVLISKRGEWEIVEYTLEEVGIVEK